MTPLQKIKCNIWKLLDTVCPATSLALKKRFSRSCSENWGYRTRLVRACPDNALIPRVPDAGKILDGFQIMHNGIKVMVGSYYGNESSVLFRKNKGVHEPQEERVFAEVLKVIPPRSVMLELGAYWAFYSMWFCKLVPQGRAFMVEPLQENLACGRKNFAANSFRGEFLHAYAGQTSGVAPDGTPVLCVDDFMISHQLPRLDILHSDIQGHELEMLRGAERTLRQGQVSWLFISTHNDPLHVACQQFLERFGLIIVTSVLPSESYACDGVLVCRSPHAPPIPSLSISKRNSRKA